jgi:hypothetical protein
MFGDARDFHLGNTLMSQAESARRGFGQIEVATTDVGAMVVDSDVDRPAIFYIFHFYDGADGQLL